MNKINKKANKNKTRKNSNSSFESNINKINKKLTLISNKVDYIEKTLINNDNNINNNYGLTSDIDTSLSFKNNIS